jgi:hypothetical protein
MADKGVSFMQDDLNAIRPAALVAAGQKSHILG